VPAASDSSRAVCFKNANMRSKTGFTSTSTCSSYVELGPSRLSRRAHAKTANCAKIELGLALGCLAHRLRECRWAVTHAAIPG